MRCTGLCSLQRKAHLLYHVADVGGLPEAKLAILAEGFVVQRAQLAEPKGNRTNAFVPASVRNFAHSRGKWGLADRYVISFQNIWLRVVCTLQP